MHTWKYLSVYLSCLKSTFRCFVLSQVQVARSLKTITVTSLIATDGKNPAL